MVMLVKLVDVQTATTLVHINIGSVLVVHRLLNLDGLRSVAFLSVQLTSIHRLDIQDSTITALLTSAVVGSGNNCLPRWVEAEVRLVHQLVVEARVHVRVVVLDRLIVYVLLRVYALRSILK